MMYQEYEVKAYFGEFYDDYAQQARDMLGKYDWAVIEHYMDSEIAEEIHLAITPCSNELFLLAYMMAHTEKYGEDFTIN